MKRYILLFITIIFLFTLSSCAKRDSAQDSSTEYFSKRTFPSEKRIPETSAPEITTVVSDPTIPANIKETNFETYRWKAYIPEVWIHDEDTSYDFESESYFQFALKDDTSESPFMLSIYVTENISPRWFWENVIYHGFTLEDYAANALPTRTISNIPFTFHEDAVFEGRTGYFTRVVSSKFDIYITFSGNRDDILMNEFLDSFSLILPDLELEDPPYPWDGKCYEPISGFSEAGNYLLHATWLHSNSCFLPDEPWDNRVVFTKGYLYVLSGDDLKVYTIDGDTITLFSEIFLPEPYTDMQADHNGNVYISSFFKEVLIFNAGTQISTLDIYDQIAMHPSGEWGIYPHYYPEDAEKILYAADGSVSLEPFTLKDTNGNYPMEAIENVFIFEDKIIVYGIIEDYNKLLFIFNLDGILLQTLTINDGSYLNSITNVVVLSDIILAMDSNSRQIYIWNSDSNLVGKTGDSDLFGTFSPWMSGFSLGDDGNIYVSMADERPDGSWDEMLIYRLNISM